MSVLYGFYDSDNHDRVYNAEEFGSMFDGLVHDGVYETYKDAMLVRASNGLFVTVGTGRAWFNHTWTYVDSPYVVKMEESEIFLDRIDAVILKIDKRLNYRQNTIETIKGAPSSSPEKPTVENNPEEGVYQYPLAYVTVKSGATVITQAEIENAIGTSACPFVTGVVDHLTTDQILAQWNSQWNFYLGWQREKIVDWFKNVQAVMEPDVAGHLQNEIDNIGSRVFLDEEGYICFNYDSLDYGIVKD